MAVEHKYVLKDYNLSYILYNQWEKMYSGFCFLSVGRVVRYTENDHICYFTITVVASMSPNGLTLFTSVSTTELSSGWVLYNLGISSSPND